MDVYLEEFDVAELLQGVHATVQPLIRGNENTLETTDGSSLGRMHSDVTKLRQALFNLLSNAAKFTQKGTIQLTAERTTEGEQDWLCFRVTDSGIGVPEDQRAQDERLASALETYEVWLAEEPTGEAAQANYADALLRVAESRQVRRSRDDPINAWGCAVLSVCNRCHKVSSIVTSTCDTWAKLSRK